MSKSKTKESEFSQTNVLNLLIDLRASNRAFGRWGHRRNMEAVINSQIAMVKSGKCWEQ